MLLNLGIVLAAQLPLAGLYLAPTERGRTVLLAAWAAAQLFLLTQLLGPRGKLFAPAFWKEDPQPRVALTFDDGPHPEDTPAILRILREEGARASFFFVADRARLHPDLARRAAEEGHEVGVHSDTHPWWFSVASPSRVRREVRDAARSLESITGRRPLHFRPPVGHKSLFLRRELKEAGLSLVTWSSRSFDTLSRSPAAICEAILTSAAPGGIVLLHEGTRRREGTRPATVAALPAIIRGLRARGLEPVSLEDLREDPRSPADPAPQRGGASGPVAPGS